MKVQRRWCLLVLASGLLSAAALPACGGEEKVVNKAQLKPGSMPPEGKWRGVYYSPLYGFLHIISDGSSVSGTWRTAAGDKWGEMNGKVEGDLMRFTWKEHRIGMFGPNATTEGNGYFRYIVPEAENADHELQGEWGLGDSDSGNPWKAIKQRNVEPDLESVLPDEASTSVKGGDWDGSKSDAASGDKTEPPAEKKEDEEGWE